MSTPCSFLEASFFPTPICLRLYSFHYRGPPFLLGRGVGLFFTWPLLHFLSRKFFLFSSIPAVDCFFYRTVMYPDLLSYEVLYRFSSQGDSPVDTPHLSGPLVICVRFFFLSLVFFFLPGGFALFFFGLPVDYSTIIWLVLSFNRPTFRCRVPLSLVNPPNSPVPLFIVFPLKPPLPSLPFGSKFTIFATFLLLLLPQPTLSSVIPLAQVLTPLFLAGSLSQGVAAGRFGSLRDNAL